MLNDLLPVSLFVFFAVFARAGSTIMLLPGFGETYVSPRARLAMALLVTLVIAPTLASRFSSVPQQTTALSLLIIGEVVIGLFLGTIARLLMSATASAGMIAANLSALANALIQDPTSAQQASIMGSFMTAVAVVLIFVLDMHHLFLVAIVDSYDLFAPGAALPMDDISQMITRVAADSFTLAARMAAPFVVVGIVFYLGLGLLAKLMPQMQVFFVAMPLQVAMGLMLMFLSLAVMMRTFIEEFEATWMLFVR